MKKVRVAMIMGSDSDWVVMKKAQQMLSRFEEEVLCEVVSAHRTPEDLQIFADRASQSGIQVIIAGAGGAAHLPGMIAAFTILPVIGVPINATSLNGMDALLSIVQMPEGIPVATVAIGNAGNAALLALRILALNDEMLSKKLKDYRLELASSSRKKSANLI